MAMFRCGSIPSVDFSALTTPDVEASVQTLAQSSGTIDCTGAKLVIIATHSSQGSFQVAVVDVINRVVKSSANVTINSAGTQITVTNPVNQNVYCGYFMYN